MFLGSEEESSTNSIVRLVPTKGPSSQAAQSCLVNELTPDQILELPVIFEDEQPEENDYNEAVSQ